MTPSFAQAFFHSAGPKFLEYVAIPAVRALLVGCAAALALAALRVKRPPARLQVWTAVLCAALAMPFLGMILPKMPLAVPASAAAKISAYAQVFGKSGQWSVVSAQQPAKLQSEQSAEQSERFFRRAASERTKASRLRREEKALAPEGVSSFERVNERRIARTDSMRDSLSQKAPLAMDAQSGAVEMPVMPLPVIAVVAENSAISPARILRTIARIALGIYAFVALILLARLFAGMWFSGKLGRAAQEIEPLYFGGADDAQNAQAREALRLLRFRSSFAALKNAPALKESAAISVPATVGVRRAAILLPLNWRAWSGEQLDAVLAHEVSHVARRDALVQALSLVHRAIFWFSPLAWWLDRQLTELAEQASDEAALAGGADRTRYAETLLGFFAQLENTPGRIWWQGVSMAKKSHAARAERRVDRILAWREGMSVKKSFAVAVSALAVPVIFFAASLHPVIAYGQDKTQSDSQNVIAPGGPKAPALPNAPKTGVKGGVAAPAIAPAPQGGVESGVAKPAIAPLPGTPAPPRGGVVAQAIAPAPGTPFAPSTPAAKQGIEAPGPMPGPMPAAPHGGVNGGVVTPAMPPAPNPALAPTGPRTVHPSAQTPPSPMVPMAAIVGVGMPALPQDTQDEKAQSAELQKELEDARKQVAADTQQVRDAREQLAKAEQSAQGSDAEQVRSAETSLREAQDKVDRAQERLERIHERIQKIAEARADRRTGELARRESERAQEVAQRAQEMAQREAERKQEMDERQAERAQHDAERAQEQAERAQQDSTRTVNITGGSYTMGGGPRYVMMLDSSDCAETSCNVSMSGDDEDYRHALNLRKTIKGPFVWFERDEKSYIITDPAFIAKAKALWAPEEALAKQQDELGRRQDELGRQQDALGEQMDKVSVKPPDVSEDLQRIQARLKELQATGATQRELGELQSELGRLQSEVGRVQSHAGAQQSVIGRQQGELGRKQGELGRKQGELGRQEAAISREASRQLRGMFDDAIKSGVAKPE